MHVTSFRDPHHPLQHAGILVVKGVQSLPSSRQRVLPLARELAKMPPEQLAALERPSTHYCVGWSIGREKFKVLTFIIFIIMITIINIRGKLTQVRRLSMPILCMMTHLENGKREWG